MSVTSGKSIYLSKALSDLAASGAAFSAPVTMYLALFTTAIVNGDPTTGVEATGSGYARKSITNNATNFPAASGSATPVSKSLHVSTALAAATGDWSSGANMVGWGLFDASSSGNLLYYGPITTPFPVLNTDVVTFAADALAWTEQ